VNCGSTAVILTSDYGCRAVTHSLEGTEAFVSAVCIKDSIFIFEKGEGCVTASVQGVMVLIR